MESRVIKPIQPKIILRQEQRKQEQRVEVYGLSLTASIPTIQQHTSYFLYTLLGRNHEMGALLFSPTGGLAKSHYFKPISELIRDRETKGCYKGEGADRHQFTNDDTERFWLTSEPLFIKELVEQGWIYFRRFEKLSDYDQKNLFLEPREEGTYVRTVSIRNLLKVMELSDSEGQDYSGIVRDFKEVAVFGDELKYISKEESFRMPINYKNTDLILRLDELNYFDPKRNQGTSMRRCVYSGRDFEHFPSSTNPWWKSKKTKRISILLREYAEQVAKIDLFFAETNKSIGIYFGISDRRYGERGPEPNTVRLLDQAVKVKEFLDRAIAEEHEEHESKEEELLDRRRKKLGLVK